MAWQLKTARDAYGKRLFSHKELLTDTQIQGYFSRRVKCKHQHAALITEKDYEAAEVENTLTDVRNEVLQQVQPEHPFMFDGYNLYYLYATQKVSKLTA